LKSRTAVIKVVFKNNFVEKREVEKLADEFMFYLIVNNTSHEIINYNSDLHNFMIVNNFNLHGLAGAYNVGIQIMANINPEYILFLDDDTPVDQLFQLLSTSFYNSFIDKSVAAVAPNYIDSRSKTKGLHILLSKYSFKRISRDYSGVSNVSYMINSCSLWRYEAVLKIGKYDEQMQIDHIDTDYCIRAIKLGYILVLNSIFSFSHNIGDRVSYRFLSKEFRSGNHSPIRRWLIMRNSIIIIRKHYRKFPILILIIFGRILYELMGILIAEKNKFYKLKMSIKGLFEGFHVSIRKKK
jgi:rhamnosyltransferase